MRIASLLASGTEIVCGLGLASELVAISHECDYPPEILDRPRVSRSRFDPAGMDSSQIDRAVRRAMERFGSVYELDEARLRELAPDLILTQAVCEVCAVPVSLAREAARALGSAAILCLDAHSIAGILDSILGVGGATGGGSQERAAVLVRQLQDRVEAVRERVAGAPRLRVLAVEWLDPLFQPGHWVPEMFEHAGGVLVAGEPGRPSREIPWDTAAAADPDALVVMPCGFGLNGARHAADGHAERLLGVARRAIEAGRAYVVDGSASFNRSGPRFADGVEILGALLHPDRFPDYSLEGRAAVWRPSGVTIIGD
jgi:iron complex transport system substrate-binding protein